MIVSFSVENFRSFDSEATLSLVASNRLAGEHAAHAIAIPGSAAKVLRTAVIYGANGAGKSNLFKALEYLKSLCSPYLYSRDKEGTGREAFRFGGRPESPTSFDLQFISDNRLYRYAIKLDDARVTEEWLGETIADRDRMIFQRGADRDVLLGEQVKGNIRLAALATVGAAPNHSFLRTIAGAALSPSEVGPELTAVRQWFSSALDLVPPGERRMSIWRKFNEDPSLLDFAGGFLRTSSTGVDRLEVLRRPLSPEELSGLAGEERARLLIDQPATGRRFFRAGRVAGDVWVESGSDGFRLVRFQSSHKNEDGHTFNMDLDDESDGTRRLLDLLPALHEMQNRGGVLFDDEIDRYIHHILVRLLLEYFLSSCTGGGSQLIFTTHESNLLDLSLLRRDEIWFAEKDRGQATHLYSLADFQVRKDLEIRKHYLQGRFGAIPFLENPDHLNEGQNGNS